MVILMASIVSPAFAFADNDKSERNGENRNNSQKSAQMEQKIEKKKVKNEHKSFKKERNTEDKKDERKEVRKEKAKKINYFFCVTATGWNVVPAEAYKENNSNNYLGEDCVKLPSSIAKRLQASL